MKLFFYVLLLSGLFSTIPGFAESGMMPSCFIASPENSFNADHLPSCDEMPFNAPFPNTASQSSGPEKSSKISAELSPAQLKELDRLMGLAMQAESASKASKFSSRSAANAAWILGLLKLHGIGMQADAQQARYWFGIAWQQGEKMASAGLAWCEIQGCGMPPKADSARYWNAQLNHYNRPRALYFEWLLESRMAPLEITKNPRLFSEGSTLPHKDLLIKAANAGDIHALIELGIDSASKNQAEAALQYFTQAESRSGVAFNNANLIRKKISQLKSLNSQQTAYADRNDAPESFFARAVRYHKGAGMPANYSEAIRLYKKAADLGHPLAQQMLKLIFSRSAADGGIDIPWMQELSQMDLSGATPRLSTAYGPTLLNREETALTDFIPGMWIRRP